MILFFTVLMFILLLMSVAALCVQLHRSVREFRAGYAEAERLATATL